MRPMAVRCWWMSPHAGDVFERDAEDDLREHEPGDGQDHQERGHAHLEPVEETDLGALPLHEARELCDGWRADDGAGAADARAVGDGEHDRGAQTRAAEVGGAAGVALEFGEHPANHAGADGEHHDRGGGVAHDHAHGGGGEKERADEARGARAEQSDGRQGEARCRPQRSMAAQEHAAEKEEDDAVGVGQRLRSWCAPQERESDKVEPDR